MHCKKLRLNRKWVSDLLVARSELLIITTLKNREHQRRLCHPLKITNTSTSQNALMVWTAYRSHPYFLFTSSLLHFSHPPGSPKILQWVKIFYTTTMKHDRSKVDIKIPPRTVLKAELRIQCCHQQSSYI